MLRIPGLLFISLFLTSCTHTYYIVRHAEKAATAPSSGAGTPDDPVLSEAGYKRAQALAVSLKDKQVKQIYSTNFKRTRLTAEPLSKDVGVKIQVYGPRPDSVFLSKLKSVKANVLVVGHSNTVDDIVNGLTNEKKLSDLDDSEYDNLFVVRYKKFFRNRIQYERKKF